MDFHEGETVPAAALKALVVEAVALDRGNLRRTSGVHADAQGAAKTKTGASDRAAKPEPTREPGSPTHRSPDPAGNRRVPVGWCTSFPQILKRP